MFKNSNEKFNIDSSYFIYAFIIICLQMTEVKLYSLKISELLVLFLGFYFFKTSFKYEKKLFIFFCIFFLKTIILNLFQTFYIPSDNNSFLKLPYIISLSRFVELMVCYMLMNLCFKFFLWKKETATRHLRNIIKIQVFIAIGFMLVYVMFLLGFLHLEGDGRDSFIVYNTSSGYSMEYRVNGFYVEGGPIGLFYGCLFVLYTIIEKKGYLIKGLIVFFLVFGAQSKAGISLIITYFIIDFFYISNKRKSILVTIFAIVTFAICFSFIIYLSYLESLSNIEVIAQNYSISGSDEIDRNHFMGRVAATVIIPNIILNNPFLGIGLGNYALVRNNPIYRGFIPEVPYWDLHGFGGGFDILIEGGIFIFIIFIIYLKNLWKRCNSDTQKKVFVVFILSFIFGVQLYFLYPWFILSYLLYLQKTQQNLKLKL